MALALGTPLFNCPPDVTSEQKRPMDIELNVTLFTAEDHLIKKL